MVRIPLQRGLFTTIDDEDVELSKYRWYTWKSKSGRLYVRRDVYINGDHFTFSLHRIIADALPKILVDHEDGDTLNNRRYNLRIVTNQQNCVNRYSKLARSTSKYRGVYWNKNNNKWHSQIRYNYKLIHIGYFSSEMEAAQAYDKKGMELDPIHFNPNLP
jgi:hypothetical protein